MVRLPAPAETIEVLVVICHHVGHLIGRCLESIRASYLGNLTLRTVVVTSTFGNFEDVFTIHNEGGPAYKRNLAVAYYVRDSTKYIVFLDDDVEVSPYCLWNLVDQMEQKPSCGMGFCKILNMERTDEFDDCGSWLTPTGFLFARAGNNQKDIGQYDASCPVLASKSATCIVRRQAFKESGGFDHRYYILGEETDLAWRIWLIGQEVWYFPQAVSWHAFGTSLKPKALYYTSERIHFHGSKNYINLLLTNLGGLRLCRILPIHLFIWLASAVGFLLRGQARRSLLILKGILWNVRNLKATWRKRVQVQRSRKVSDRDLWKMIYRLPRFSYYTGRMRRYLIQTLHG